METSVDCNQDDVVAGSTHIEGNFIHNPPSKMNPAKYQCLIVKSLLMANPWLQLVVMQTNGTSSHMLNYKLMRRWMVF